MAIFRFEDRSPSIGKDSFIFPGADIIGDVRIGERCFIGPGARIRGDYGTVIIGNGTSIEDNCVIHARPGEICRIGDNVTVGHGSVIHNCTINDWAIVGMGSVVSDYAELENWAVVAEGAVVKNNAKIPEYCIAAGIPAKVIGRINEGYMKTWTDFKKIYVELASTRYPNGLERVDP